MGDVMRGLMDRISDDGWLCQRTVPIVQVVSKG
jgi:hypothetical protein